jgi:hypothetical protein
MSEESEIETQTNNAMDAMLDAVYQKNLALARGHFDTLMNDKISDALENEKISISRSIYNQEPEYDEEEIPLETDDVEVDEEEWDEHEASAEDESEWDESDVEDAFDESDLEQELQQAEIDELEV